MSILTNVVRPKFKLINRLRTFPSSGGVPKGRGGQLANQIPQYPLKP